MPHSTEPDAESPLDPTLPKRSAFDMSHPSVAALIADCRAIHANGSLDRACAHLRARGLSKVESIAVMAQALDVELTDAKRLVHLSPAWADRRAGDEELHDRLEEALDEIVDGDEWITLR